MALSIRDYLKRRPASSKEIQAVTGLSQTAVARQIRNMGDFSWNPSDLIERENTVGCLRFLYLQLMLNILALEADGRKLWMPCIKKVLLIMKILLPLNISGGLVA